MRLAPLGLLFATSLLGTGCRDFKVPPEPHGSVPIGVVCAASEECESALCADGVCCERSCAPDELCSVAGHEGRCAPRPPGTACTEGAQCPGGRCLHTADASYCFEGDCAADERYDLPGHEGVCTPRPPGAPCGAAEECPGGRCVAPAAGGASFCCDRDCGPTERCDLPGHEGLCAARSLGEACETGAQCPSGQCVDGVCCESACEGDCKSCALPAGPGRCLDVPENQDPRNRCGFCGACTQGFCGAALANSAPKKECGEKGVCSASQTCGLPTGELCESDAACALGACVVSRCFASSQEQVYPNPVDPPPSSLVLTGLAAGPEGASALGVGSVHVYPTGAADPNGYTTMVFGASGWERASDVSQDFDRGVDLLVGGMTFWGGRLYQVQYHPCSAASGCGLVGQLFGSELQPGSRETISAPTAIVSAAFVASDASQQLWAAYSDESVDPPQVHVAQRVAQAGAPPQWQQRSALPEPPYFRRPLWGAEAMGDELYVVGLALDARGTPSVSVWRGSSGALVSSRDLPEDCYPDTLHASLLVGRFGSGPGQGLAIAANCSSRYLLTWTPGAPEPWWTAENTAVSAAAVSGAEFPTFLLFESAGDLTDLVLWWRSPEGTWTGRTAFRSGSGASVWDAWAVAGADGAPVISFSVYVPWASEPAPTSVRALRFHR